MSKGVKIGQGLVKSEEPNEEMRTRLGRRKFIILTGPKGWWVGGQWLSLHTT